MQVQDYKNESLFGDGTLNGLAISVLLHLTALFLMVIVSVMLPRTQTPSPVCVVDLLVEDMAGGGAEGGESGAMRAGDGKPEPTSPPEAESVSEPELERPDAVYLSEVIDLPENPPPVQKKMETPREKPRPKPKPQPKPIRVEKPTTRPNAAASTHPRPEIGKADAADAPTADYGKGLGTENGSGSGLADSGKGHGTGHGVGAGIGTGHGPLDASFGSGNGPRFATKALPKYPRLARELGKEGTVLLRLTIDERGRLMDVEVMKRAGSGFDEEAVRAVRDSSFTPARIDGKPVKCKAQLPIRFVLNGTERE